MTVAYPSIPCPQSIRSAPTERRIMGTRSRPINARSKQLDESAFENVSWPPFNATQYSTFRAWWRDDLVYGGAWFTAAWPSPRGQISLKRRFLSTPKWEFIGGQSGGYWQISADLEVRGRITAATSFTGGEPIGLLLILTQLPP